MTTTPAMPEPLGWYVVNNIGMATLCKDEAEAQLLAEDCDMVYQRQAPHRAVQLVALAALQAQPAEVSDAVDDFADKFDGWIETIKAAHDESLEDLHKSSRAMLRDLIDEMEAARAILALRPQAESESPTVEAAREMGAKGGPVVEAERLAFEAWMAGHCWKVSPTWNGQTYDDSEEDKKRNLLDPLARTTRMLWAAWRDRAALNARPQAVPMTRASRDAIMAARTADGDADEWPEPWAYRRGWEDAEAHHCITAPAGGEG